MTDTYTSPTITNYNDNPPDDDGTISTDNMVEWAKHINEIGDPLKNYIDSVNSAASSAFAVHDKYHLRNMLEFVSSGSGSSASPYVINTTALQADIDSSTNVKYVYHPGYVWEQDEITVTSTGRATDSSLGTIYRSGVHFDFTGAELRAASGVADLFTFTDVSDFSVCGYYMNGDVSSSFIKVNSTGTAVRLFHIDVNRIKGGATSGVGTTGNGVILDSTNGNIAAFRITSSAGMWTHVNHALYLKNTSPGSGIDTGIIENITSWPYGGAATAGYGILVEAATDITFKRIYAGLFEHNDAACIYIHPTYSEGVKNCVFNDISCDVSNSIGSCETIRGLADTSGKPIEGNRFSNIKMYKAASGTAGNPCISIGTSGSGVAQRNLFENIWSNDTSVVKAISFGTGCSHNVIIPTGTIAMGTLSSAWLSDQGDRNVILGYTDTILYADNYRDNVTAGGATTARTHTITGGQLDLYDGIVIRAAGQIVTNANDLTIALKFGGSTVATYTTAASETGSYELVAEIYNQNSKSSQVYHSKVFLGTSLVAHASGTLSINTTTGATCQHIITLAGSPGSDNVNADLFEVSPKIQTINGWSTSTGLTGLQILLARSVVLRLSQHPHGVSQRLLLKKPKLHLMTLTRRHS